ncbi:FeoA family protein [Spirochaeta thermophila DSM 6578]|uniref:FeoA family protein n=1 Tax=Winmispira thermophila (strain ATCC 700085 / DSM 6578 / Z-1203) TaxID=869211 RepID=G0GA85_WINT7|nr:FeoA family protein [Spirochaeta thermophila]AEJ60921.1 FeoA family protein [Spirochaeta thermophila DSM 6578]
MPRFGYRHRHGRMHHLGMPLPLEEADPGGTVTLSRLREGEKAVVVGFKGGPGPYRRKLLAMGFIPGTPIAVKRRAPLGDPVEVELRGYLVSVRRDEAEILLLRRAS